MENSNIYTNEYFSLDNVIQIDSPKPVIPTREVLIPMTNHIIHLPYFDYKNAVKFYRVMNVQEEMNEMMIEKGFHKEKRSVHHEIWEAMGAWFTTGHKINDPKNQNIDLTTGEWKSSWDGRKRFDYKFTKYCDEKFDRFINTNHYFIVPGKKLDSIEIWVAPGESFRLKFKEWKEKFLIERLTGKASWNFGISYKIMSSVGLLLFRIVDSKVVYTFDDVDLDELNEA